MTYEDLCETLDEMGVTPDTPIVIRDEDNLLWEVEAIVVDGTAGYVQLTIVPSTDEE